jgi:hypothetical protein
MTFIAGAKILAERIAGKASPPRAEVSADAPPLFQWCGVNPTEDDLRELPAPGIVSTTNPA